MLTEPMGITVGSVGVQTTDNRGFTPEETAVRCVNKIIGISDNAHPAIRDQAYAYRIEMEKIMAIYSNNR